MTVVLFPGISEFHPVSRLLSNVPQGAKVLWVTSAGGHLAEALRIDDSLLSRCESLWVTFDSAQSRSLLAGRRRTFVDYVAPRDLVGSARAARTVNRILQREKFDFCVSTGAAVAGLALPLAALRGISTHYVESLARAKGPSATGRLMSAVPRVATYSQYESWASRRWRYAGSVLDNWHGSRLQPSSQRKQRRILVTLGTIRPYRFDRAVDAVLAVLRPDDRVVWQLGATRRTDVPGDVFDELSADRLAAIAADSDVVVAHAGVGSLLQLLEIGRCPVLVVRSGANREHVDDHQRQIALAIAGRGLATILDLGHPDRAVLDEAANTEITRNSSVTPPSIIVRSNNRIQRTPR